MSYGVRPRPTEVVHYTDLANIGGIGQHGMECDSHVKSGSREVRESGSSSIKFRRRMKPVPCGPGGTVGDYVPFYFAPRSPMMISVYVYKNFPEITTKMDEQVYLVTTTERLSDAGHTLVMSDRNASQVLATFGLDGDIDDKIDWPLMKQRQWGKTDDDLERPDRRQAETLVYRAVSWEAIDYLVVHNQRVGDEVVRVLAEVGATKRVVVNSDWYF